MKIYSAAKYPQCSPEWWELRRGIPTASGFDRILTPKTMKPSASQDEYIAELVGDMNSLNPPYFTQGGKPINSFAVQNGKDMEPEARAWYGFQAEADVTEVGFVTTDDGRFGCSPDGLVGDDGGLELKVPLPKTHAAYILKGELPSEYKCQVHGSLVVTGRKWWDFMSYCPGMDPLLIRVTPDEFTKRLAEELEGFWVKLQAAADKVYPERRAVREVEAAFRKWAEAVGADRDRFNGQLEDLSGLKPEPKRAAWNIVLSHAAKQGWVFDRPSKTFQPRNEVEAAIDEAFGG